MTEDRCTGHCCEDIVLNNGPEEMQKAADNNIGQWPLLNSIMQYQYVDFSHPDSRLHNKSLDLKLKTVNMAFHYKCKEYQGNGRCGIYETRPNMCRKHGTDHTQGCGNSNCTWKKAKSIRNIAIEKELKKMKRKK